MTGKESITLMRELLADTCPGVRAVAVGTLAFHRDRVSAGQIGKAVVGIEDGFLACAVIDRLAEWNSIVVVPSLISFLENDMFVYQDGDDLGIPAIQAQEALRHILADDPDQDGPREERNPFAENTPKQDERRQTPYLFPFDVATSGKAWEQVKHIVQREERLKQLVKILKTGSPVWKAELARLPDAGPVVVLVNQSRRSVTVTKHPEQISLIYATGSSSTGSGVEVGKAEFVTVPSGGSFRVPLRGPLDALRKIQGTERLGQVTVYPMFDNVLGTGGIETNDRRFA